MPDVVIINILRFLDLSELIQTVSKTCKRLYTIIYENSRLLRHCYFDFPLELTETQLQAILKHSVGFEEFLIGCATIKCSITSLNLLLTENLSHCNFLYWLDLTGCRLSTLCFLKNLKSLQILNLSECCNLTDEEFEIIVNCKNLDQLYLSYTTVKPMTIISIVSKLRLISLDVCGIGLSVRQCNDIIECTYSTLDFLYLTLQSSEDKDQFDRLLDKYRDCYIRTTR